MAHRTPSELATYYRQALESRNYQFEEAKGDTTITLAFRGESFEITVSAFFGMDYCSIHAALPLTVGDQELPSLLVKLNELNSRNPVGAFEYHDLLMKIAFKYGFKRFEDISVDEFESLINFSVSTIDSRADAIAEVLGVEKKTRRLNQVKL